MNSGVAVQRQQVFVLDLRTAGYFKIHVNMDYANC